MIPIEKNVIVVDEQGNEYEATYPKRAKGLVKSGRARFVDENKICLACPPNIYLEDKKMNNNITAREIFDRITAVTNQMESIEKILFKVQCVYEHAEYVPEAENEIDQMHFGEPLEYSEKVALTKIETIKEIACTREQTLKMLLNFYIEQYNSLKQ